MLIVGEFTPLDPVAGARPVVRLCSANLSGVTSLNNLKWQPAFSGLPTLAMQFFGGDFEAGGTIEPGGASMTLQVESIERANSLARRFVWQGAGVKLWAGKIGDAWPWRQVFVGNMDRTTDRDNRISLSAQVDLTPFDKDVLSSVYPGTGGANGGADLKDRPKPFLAGYCENAEPILIDTVNNVWQFHGYGPINAVLKLYERAGEFPAASANYATYAALVAATILPGHWATCLAEGMIRLGAPNFGVITGDVQGHKPAGTYLTRTGAIISAAATLAGVPGASLNATSLTTLDSQISTLTGGGGIIGVYETSQIRFPDFAKKLASDVNALAAVDFLGVFFVKRLVIGTPTITLDFQGKALPPVSSSSGEIISTPFSFVEFGARRSWRVHTLDEISTTLILTPRGPYEAATVYRAGDIASLPDGSSFLYINATPGAGVSPPTATHWESVETATEVDFASVTGPTKPADNADVTADSIQRHEQSVQVSNFTASHLAVLDPSNQLPRVINISRIKGSTDVSSTSTYGTVWAIVSQGTITGGTLTVSNGMVTIPTGSVIPKNTTIQVSSALDGLTILSTVSISRTDAAAPNTGGGSGGTTVSDTTFGSVSGTGWVDISDEMTVKTGSAGTITLSAPLETIVDAASPANTFDVETRWIWKTVGGSDNILATVSSSPDAESYTEDNIIYEAFNGAVTNNPAAVTGLSATTDHKVRLQARRSTSSPTKTVTFSGQATATGT